MKKYIIILIMLLLVVGCNKSKNNKENNNKPKPNQEMVVINLFHWSQCSHCKEEINWLKELEKREDYIKVNYYEVTEYQDLTAKVREELDVLGEGVPLTVIGSDYILGFGDSTKSRFMNIIEKYHEKDYCDIVSLIQDGKDTTDCYLKNA